MTSDELKKGISVYILPILFCGLLIVLALLRNEKAESAYAREVQAGEPLTLTDAAIENYLYGDGFTLNGEQVLDAQGQAAAVLAVTKDGNGEIEAMALTFPLPTFFETDISEGLSSLKAKHDEAAQRGETLFLALFDAVAATDSRISVRRDSALTKLHTAMDTGKAATQSANSWRFSFSLEPGEFAGRVTILFTLVK